MYWVRQVCRLVAFILLLIGMRRLALASTSIQWLQSFLLIGKTSIQSTTAFRSVV
jgi:hypothetical protein